MAKVHYDLTHEEARQFHENGYVIKRGLFSAEEAELMRKSARENPDLLRHAFERDDGEGGRAKLVIWNRAGDDVLSLVTRSRRVVENSALLLGGEVYIYHTKLSAKEAHGGGAWTWHQDYGYWYSNYVLFPHLLSAIIALDPHRPDNGCLQLVRGSHHLGRINHILEGEQASADPERMTEILKRLPIEEAILAPGDALFMHCNTLHCSGPNRSPDPRWALICCYNRATNDPYQPSRHCSYEPINLVQDDALLRLAQGAPKTTDDGEYAVYEPVDTSDWEGKS